MPITIHPEKCSGCNLCLYHCSLKHTGSTNPKASRIHLVKNTGGYDLITCLHCKDAVCAEACPTNAITRDEHGAIQINNSRCIKCMLCVVACPYGGMSYAYPNVYPFACDLCQGIPECVRVCPTQALEFAGIENISALLKQSHDVEAKGTSLCLGCTSELAFRFAMRILGKNTIVVIPPSCASILVAGFGIKAQLDIPAHLSQLPNSASIISGIKRHFINMGKEVNVVAFTGDGGTADIGFQALSGAAERNEDVIYICNDNEAYMNTGIQRSGTTPMGAWTTTTEVGDVLSGKTQHNKNMPLIMLEHDIPYVATASVGFLSDFEAKLRKAMKLKGFRYLHILNPCPTGWRFSPELGIEIARKSVQTNVFPLWEAENGNVSITVNIDDPRPVEEYTRLMKRFSHLGREQLSEIQEKVNSRYKRLKALARLSVLD